MKHWNLTIWWALCIFFTIAAFAHAASVESVYPGATNKLFLDTQKAAIYGDLSQTIGFEYGRTYSYQEYTDVKRANKVGVAGKYEYLLLSTGGSGGDWGDTEKFTKAHIAWEMMYYSNHDVTVITELAHNSDKTFVRILKLCKGRNPRLNLE